MHIIERFVIHFVASTFLVLAVYFALHYWHRKNRKVQIFISGQPTHLVVVSALIVFALMPLREPFDVAFGQQVWYKAMFDQISWLLGVSVGAWGLCRYRTTKE